MRVLVCGGRDYVGIDQICMTLDRIHSERPISAIVYGMGGNTDFMAAMWATCRGINRMGFAANWEAHGRAAGPIRNQEMLDRGAPDLGVSFPGGRGTADMVRRLKSAGIQLIEIAR